MRDFIITNFEKSHLPSATALVEKCFVNITRDHNALPSRSLKSIFDPNLASQHADMQNYTNRQYWVAVDGASVVGVIGLMEEVNGSADTVWLNWFCVAPNYRGKRLGKALLMYAEEQARKCGKTHLQLWTSDASNEASAQILYEKQGLYITSQEPCVDGDATLLIYRGKRLDQ